MQWLLWGNRNFFVGLQQKQSIENADYSALVTWQQENESPFDKLCQLMDDNGVVYEWKTNEDGEEYIYFLMSDNGAYWKSRAFRNEERSAFFGENRMIA